VLEPSRQTSCRRVVADLAGEFIPLTYDRYVGERSPAKPDEARIDLEDDVEAKARQGFDERHAQDILRQGRGLGPDQQLAFDRQLPVPKLERPFSLILDEARAVATLFVKAVKTLNVAVQQQGAAQPVADQRVLGGLFQRLAIKLDCISDAPLLDEDVGLELERFDALRSGGNENLQLVQSLGKAAESDEGTNRQNTRLGVLRVHRHRPLRTVQACRPIVPLGMIAREPAQAFVIGDVGRNGIAQITKDVRLFPGLDDQSA